ncbi:MAG: hypothetical protein ACRYG2_00225 [Janthinobacterium lividum]
MTPKNRLRSLLVAAALVGAGAVVAPAPAQAAYSDPLATTGSTGLVWHPTPAATLTALDDALPNVSANDVVHDPTGPMTTCSSTERAALPAAPAATQALCWDSDRATSTAWTPQSMTTSGDADDDGMWGADRIFMAGWHGDDGLSPDPTTGKTRYNDARIAFVNANDLSSASFSLAYLVEPTGTNSFKAAKAHMGGMAWYGDKVYVTAVGNTGTAIRVFSTKHLLRMTSTASSIGKVSSGYAAYGYRYAMVQIGSYSYAGGTCDMGSDTGVACFSSISLDRSNSPASLVATEYFSDQTKHSRLYRFGMGTDYLLGTSSGTATSSQAFRSGVVNLQGVLSYGGRWWVAHSSATARGQLWGQTTGGSTASSCADSATACWSRHPESLTLDVSTGLVWSVTEWTPAECSTKQQTCGRALFAVPRSSLP